VTGEKGVGCDKLQAMKSVMFTNDNVCAYVDVVNPKYVVFNGTLAGVSDHAELEGSAEPLDRRPDEVKLEG
jgi:hypothetical protein